MLHNACLARLRLAFVFFFPSTAIRIRIRPNTAVNHTVFGRILKNPYSVQPYKQIMYHTCHVPCQPSLVQDQQWARRVNRQPGRRTTLLCCPISPGASTASTITRHQHSQTTDVPHDCTDELRLGLHHLCWSVFILKFFFVNILLWFGMVVKAGYPSAF